MTTESTRNFIQNLERRYGAPKVVGRGNVLLFGQRILFAVSNSKLHRNSSYFYAVQEDFLQQDFLEAIPPDVQIYAALICGDPKTTLILPHALVSSLISNHAKNRVHVLPRNNGYFFKTSGHPAIDVTQYINAYPLLESTTQEATANAPTEEPPAVEPIEQQTEEINAHTHIQWMLIRFGRAAGHDIWVPANDRGKNFEQEAFTRLTIPELPNFGFDSITKQIISNIDVLWLEENVIYKAFEIESTTSVYSGLLRMSDLILSQPNISIDLHIVAPNRRREIVRKNILRPTFSRLRPKCSYISFDEVATKFEIVQNIPPRARIADLLEDEQF